MKSHQQALALLAPSGKRRKSRRLTSPVAALFVARPYRCVVLAIDPGENSGWAMVAHGKLVQWGEVDVFDRAAVAAVVAGALTLATIAGDPLVLVIEKAFRGETGASRPLWMKAWTDAGLKPRRAVKVLPSVWRSRFFGRGAGAWKQERARCAEQGYAHGAIANAYPEAIFDGELGHDACAAICIGVFASKSPLVGKLLPIGIRRLSEVA